MKIRLRRCYSKALSFDKVSREISFFTGHYRVEYTKINFNEAFDLSSKKHGGTFSNKYQYHYQWRVSGIPFDWHKSPKTIYY